MIKKDLIAHRSILFNSEYVYGFMYQFRHSPNFKYSKVGEPSPLPLQPSEDRDPKKITLETLRCPGSGYRYVRVGLPVLVLCYTGNQSNLGTICAKMQGLRRVSHGI